MSFGVQKIHNPYNFEKVLAISKSRPVLIDFSATWCGPCKAIAPTFDRYSKKYPDLHFAKLDIDECEEIAIEYEVNTVPTFLLIIDGKERKRITGADPERLKRVIYRFSGKE